MSLGYLWVFEDGRTAKTYFVVAIAVCRGTDMENWIVYDGDVTIDDFLEKNQPTKIHFINIGVLAGDPKQRPRECQYPLAIAESQKTTLLQEWEQIIKKPWRITRNYVQKLAKKYAYMSGKWIIYCPR